MFFAIKFVYNYSSSKMTGVSGEGEQVSMCRIIIAHKATLNYFDHEFINSSIILFYVWIIM